MRALPEGPGEALLIVDLLATDLRRYLNHRPVIARGNSPGDRARKFIRRHRLASAASAGAILAVCDRCCVHRRQERMAAEEAAQRLAAAHARPPSPRELQSRGGAAAATGTESNIEPLLRRLGTSLES